MLRRCPFRFLANTSTSIPSWHSTFSAEAKEYIKSPVGYDLKLFDTIAWTRRPFEFDQKAWDPNQMTTHLKQRLCAGKETKEYTLIGECFSFPDHEDSPVVNDPQHPAKLWWDHESPTEKILIQLTPHTPPLLWIGIKPTVDAMKKVFVEFLDVDAEHVQKYLPEYEERQKAIEERSGAALYSDATNKHNMKETVLDEIRKKDPTKFEFDWDKSTSVSLGTFENFRIVENKFMSNPFVFGWPLLLSDGNHFSEDQPIRYAAFRTVLSKSILLVHGRLDFQLDPRMANVDSADQLILEVPVFATINYKSNVRMCGGEALVKRFNTVMGSDFPL
eukprot:PhF_6_TR37887/c1_g4_i1/m.56532